MPPLLTARAAVQLA